MLMTVAAVAAAGPIGSVGLAVPHIVRLVTEPDYRWLMPYSAFAGVILRPHAARGDPARHHHRCHRGAIPDLDPAAAPSG